MFPRAFYFVRNFGASQRFTTASKIRRRRPLRPVSKKRSDVTEKRSAVASKLWTFNLTYGREGFFISASMNPRALTATLNKTEVKTFIKETHLAKILKSNGTTADAISPNGLPMHVTALLSDLSHEAESRRAFQDVPEFSKPHGVNGASKTFLARPSDLRAIGKVAAGYLPTAVPGQVTSAATAARTELKTYIKEVETYLAKIFNPNVATAAKVIPIALLVQVTAAFSGFTDGAESGRLFQNVTESLGVDEESKKFVAGALAAIATAKVAVGYLPKTVPGQVTATATELAARVGSWKAFQHAPEFSTIRVAAGRAVEKSKPYLTRALKGGVMATTAFGCKRREISEQVWAAVCSGTGGIRSSNLFGKGPESSKISGVVGGAVGVIAGATFEPYLGGLCGSAIGGALGGAAVQATDALLEKKDSAKSSVEKQRDNKN